MSSSGGVGQQEDGFDSLVAFALAAQNESLEMDEALSINSHDSTIGGGHHHHHHQHHHHGHGPQVQPSPPPPPPPPPLPPYPSYYAPPTPPSPPPPPPSFSSSQQHPPMMYAPRPPPVIPPKPPRGKKRKGGGEGGGGDLISSPSSSAYGKSLSPRSLQVIKVEGGGGRPSSVNNKIRRYPLPPISQGASSRKPVDESKADASMQARASLISARWGSDNPRLTTLVNSLSSRMRHFAMYEWFYSTIDRAFFNHNDFRDCLEMLGLGHIPSLSRPEWSALRSALGRPRRLSPTFLRQERSKLEQYRRKVRSIQKGTISTPPIGFEYEIPVPLVVGQSINAYHKRSKLLARGQILTVDYERAIYRIQYDRPELGSEICSDAVIAVDGPPDLLFARPRYEERLLSQQQQQRKATKQEEEASRSSGKRAAEEARKEALPLPPGLSPEGSRVIQAQLMVFIRKMLERKQALLTALRTMNDHAEAVSVSSTPSSTTNLYPPVFKQEYNWVVNALHKTNAALHPALDRLRHLVVQKQGDTEGKEEAGGGGGGATGSSSAAAAAAKAKATSSLDFFYDIQVSPMVKTVLNSSQEQAKDLYQGHRATKLGDFIMILGGEAGVASAAAAAASSAAGGSSSGSSYSVTGMHEGRSAQELIEACAALLTVIRHCAEERKQHNMTALDVEQCVAAALQEVRSRCTSPVNDHLYQEIEKSVSLLKRELLA